MIPQLMANAHAIAGEGQPEFEGLPIECVVIDGGLGLGQCIGLRSEWKLSSYELDILMKGGSVYLTVLSRQMVPVMMEVGEAGR
jgi:hypothetical protein